MGFRMKLVPHSFLKFFSDHNLLLTLQKLPIILKDMFTPETRISGLQQHYNISSREDLCSFTSHLSKRLGGRLTIPSAPLNCFLEDAYANTGLGSLVFLDRREKHIPPIVDVYAVWSTPFTLTSPEEGQQVDELVGAHLKFLTGIEPSFDTLLHLIEPVEGFTIENFESSLPAQFEPNTRYEVVGSATFLQNQPIYISY